MPQLLAATTIVVWLVFAVAVAGKIRGRARLREFRRSLVATGLVPRRWATAAAATVLAAETATLVLLLAPVTRPVGFALAVAVMAGFVTGVWLVVRRGVRAVCRCFGAAGGPLSGVHLARNLTLLGVSLAGLVASLTSATPIDPRSPVLLPVAVAAVVVAVLLIRAEDVAALVRPAAAPDGPPRRPAAPPRRAGRG